MEILEIDFHFSNLRCLKSPNNGRTGPPFLWTVFFKVDGQAVRVRKDFRITGKARMHYSEGSHGNLVSEMPAEGVRIGIPDAIGRWQTSLKPIPVPIFETTFPALIGAVSVLLMQGNVTDAGAEAGHQRLNHYIGDAINQSISHFDPRRVNILHAEESVKKYFEHRVLTFTEGVVGTVENAVRNAQSILENLWSLTRKDTLVGFQIWEFYQHEIFRNSKQIPLSVHLGDESKGLWEISGNLSGR
ncbi:MAG: hypothetical protein KDI06_06430 [Calditrichaeota bacterium]|nr:hypothetical protein [Calditrichota bacterium]